MTTSAYEVIEATDREVLAGRVTPYLLKGWECQGGICVVALGDDEYLYVQAIVYSAREGASR